MARNQETLNKEMYQFLQSNGYEPKAFDVEGKLLATPDEAALIRFTFKDKDKDLGAARITIDRETGVTIYFDNDIEHTGSHAWRQFLKQMKDWSMRKQLGFDLQNTERLKYDMAQRQYTEQKEKLGEGYHAMGKNMSYNDNVPSVKIILQHNRKLEEGEQRYRSIAKIFLENTDGERFLAPTTRPGIAQVYARHIAEGGVPNDERWNHVKALCEEYSKMAGFARAVRNGQFNESAQQLVNEGLNHYQSLRETLGKLRGHRGYNMYFESWTPALMEDDTDSTINELFVQETVDPRIESVMPILARLNKNKATTTVKEVAELAEWADSITEMDDGIPDNLSASERKEQKERDKKEYEKNIKKIPDHIKKKLNLSDKIDEQGVAEARLDKSKYFDKSVRPKVGDRVIVVRKEFIWDVGDEFKVVDIDDDNMLTVQIDDPTDRFGRHKVILKQKMAGDLIRVMKPIGNINSDSDEEGSGIRLDLLNIIQQLLRQLIASSSVYEGKNMFVVKVYRLDPSERQIIQDTLSKANISFNIEDNRGDTPTLVKIPYDQNMKQDNVEEDLSGMMRQGVKKVKRAIDWRGKNDPKSIRKAIRTATDKELRDSYLLMFLDLYDDLMLGDEEKLKGTPNGMAFKLMKQELKRRFPTIPKSNTKPDSVEETLDKNQKRVGQLGATEKVSKKGTRGKLVGEAVAYNSPEESVIMDIVNGNIDAYDVMNNPKSEAEQKVSGILQDMYERISIDRRLHPDDDFEEIIEIIMDELSSEYDPYPMSESINENAQDSVANALYTRVTRVRTDLIAKFGIGAINDAIDEISSRFAGEELDEIGSSDVSGWIREMEQILASSSSMSEGYRPGEINDGDKVKFKDDSPYYERGTWTVSQCDGNKCWIGDEEDRGWYVYMDELELANSFDDDDDFDPDFVYGKSEPEDDVDSNDFGDFGDDPRDTDPLDEIKRLIK